MQTKKVMLVFGTRPEAIKMAPVVRALAHTSQIEPLVVVTAQHRQLLDQVLGVFGILPDEDLDIMEEDQRLPDLFARVLQRLSRSIKRHRPDMVLVHGDTTTTASAALAAFYARVPVGHVEAGLRTGDIMAPWPEEANRRIVAPLAALHFAPTDTARINLLAEGVPATSIHVTGNTVVDALLAAVRAVEADGDLRHQVESQLPPLKAGAKLVLVTGHRRENLGPRLEQICGALAELATDPGVEVIYPVHPNPSVRRTVEASLGGLENVHLVSPLGYLPFIWLMRRADVILTDSGGVQEEAPTFGTPVLVLRDATERPEAVDAGAARLVGSSREAITHHARALLRKSPSQERTAPNPFGDGSAGKRIAGIVHRWLAEQEK